MLTNLPPNLQTLSLEAMDAPSATELRQSIEDARWPLSLTDLYFHDAKSMLELGDDENGADLVGDDENGADLDEVRRSWSAVAELCESRNIRLWGIEYLEPDDDDDEDGDGDDGGDGGDGGDKDGDDRFAVNSLDDASDDGAGSDADG